MKYIIGKTYVTEAKHSVDGKKHTRTTYYSGMIDIGMGMVAQNWATKKEALRFITKRQAQQVLRRLGEETARIIKVEESK